jgi:hypothetical protein
VLAVARNQPIQATETIRLRPDDLATGLAESAWEHRSCGPGAKGERFYDWAWIHIHTPTPTPESTACSSAAAPAPANSPTTDAGHPTRYQSPPSSTSLAAAVMIMAMAGRDLALPAPSVAAQSPLLLASTTSATTCGVLRLGDIKPGALSAPHRR